MPPFGASAPWTSVERVLEGVDHRERHHLEHDPRSVVGRVATELREALDQHRHRHRGLVEVADLDVARAEHLGRLEQLAAQRVRCAAALAVHEPVGQELELEVTNAIVVEDPAHFGQAVLRAQVHEVGMPDAETREAGPGCGFGTLAQPERAPFVIGVRLRAAADRPVRRQQLDVAHRALVPAT